MDSVATLIREEITVNDIGQEIKVESRRRVFCKNRGITRGEFYSAANAGLKPEVVLVLSTQYDWRGETLVEWNGVRYSVMRSYTPEDSDSLELTLQEEVADYGA